MALFSDVKDIFSNKEFSENGLRKCSAVIASLAPNIRSYTQHIFHCLQIIEDPKGTDKSKHIATFDLLSSGRYLADLFDCNVCDKDVLMCCGSKIDEQLTICCQEKAKKAKKSEQNAGTEKVEAVEENGQENDGGGHGS